MRKGYFAFLGFMFVAAAMLQSGCAGADPFVINSVNELKGGQVTLMDEYDGLVTEYNVLAKSAGKPEKPKLPKAYRDDKTGAFDDLNLYLKGERPAKEGK